MDILENITKIHAEINEINPLTEIIAATKTRTAEEIKIAISSGFISSCGENRVQELLAKYEKNVVWDFIGRLQTNKVKYIIDKVRIIHSLDRLELAVEIDKQANKISKVQDCLIEINAGKEESKGGIILEDLPEFLDTLGNYKHINIIGLMAVVPKGLSEIMSRKIFDSIYTEFIKFSDTNFRCLSMGMSDDYLSAVKSGANMVRLGRAIFGERDIDATGEKL